jgi:hypothetical protein
LKKARFNGQFLMKTGVPSFLRDQRLFQRKVEELLPYSKESKAIALSVTQFMSFEAALGTLIAGGGAAIPGQASRACQRSEGESAPPGSDRRAQSSALPE